MTKKNSLSSDTILTNTIVHWLTHICTIWRQTCQQVDAMPCLSVCLNKNQIFDFFFRFVSCETQLINDIIKVFFLWQPNQTFFPCLMSSSLRNSALSLVICHFHYSMFNVDFVVFLWWKTEEEEKDSDCVFGLQVEALSVDCCR